MLNSVSGAAAANANGLIGAADYTPWRDHATGTLTSSILVSKPSTFGLLAALVFLSLTHVVRHR